MLVLLRVVLARRLVGRPRKGSSLLRRWPDLCHHTSSGPSRLQGGGQGLSPGCLASRALARACLDLRCLQPCCEERLWRVMRSPVVCAASGVVAIRTMMGCVHKGHRDFIGEERDAETVQHHGQPRFMLDTIVVCVGWLAGCCCICVRNNTLD